MERIETLSSEQRLPHQSGMIDTTAANVRDLLGQSWRSHVMSPIEDGNYVKAALGFPLALGEMIFTAPDAVMAGIAGTRLEPLEANSLARTGRNVSTIASETLNGIGNLLTFHPIEALKNTARAVLGAIRTPVDMIIDFADAAGGYDVVDRSRTHFQKEIFALTK